MGLPNEDIPATISALDDFIQNLFLEISAEESLGNLENGLVEIRAKTNPRSPGNALLITDDGYFLTAAHCFRPLYQASHISLPDGNVYPLEKFYIRHTHADIALGKADIKAKPCARHYLLCNTYDIQKRTRVTLLTRKAGQLIKKKGLTGKTATYLFHDTKYDHFELQFPCEPGDSGGIIVDSNGKLSGFLSTGDTSISDAAYILDGLQLIQAYKEKLSRRLERRKKLK